MFRILLIGVESEVIAVEPRRKMLPINKREENTNTAKAPEFVSVCEQWNPASQTNNQADHLRSRTSSVVTIHGPIPQS